MDETIHGVFDGNLAKTLFQKTTNHFANVYATTPYQRVHCAHKNVQVVKP